MRLTEVFNSDGQSLADRFIFGEFYQENIRKPAKNHPKKYFFRIQKTGNMPQPI